MTVRTRLAGQILLLIVAIVALGSAAMVGMYGIRQDFRSALRGYESLRQLYEIGWNIAAAKVLVSLPRPELGFVALHLQVARRGLDQIESTPDRPEMLSPVRSDLDRAIAEVREGSVQLPGTIDTILRRLRDEADTIRNEIEQNAADAERRKVETTMLLGGVAIAALLGAMAIGAVQYQSIVRPLRRFAESARLIASGRFADRVETRGDREFADLATDFNRMAGEVDRLYRNLEQQVQVQTNMLIRSERLAGVGALAAGVAHEINNPLGIIAGYAQVQLQQLQSQGRADDPAAQTLRVICDEAFRAKQVIERLLSLARNNGQGTRLLDPAVVAHELVKAVSVLPAARDRKVELVDDPEDDTLIRADEGLLRQVLLNLVVNALQATQPQTGQVTIRVQPAGTQVQIVVEDNGTGIAPEVLPRLFEPFYSARAPDLETGQRGVGLGLSISHAIVQSLGGTIEAQSDGVGKGSRFIVTLPVADEREEP